MKKIRYFFLLVAAVLVFGLGLVLPSSEPAKAAGQQLTEFAFGPINFEMYYILTVPGLTPENFVSIEFHTGTCDVAQANSSAHIIESGIPVTPAYMGGDDYDTHLEGQYYFAGKIIIGNKLYINFLNVSGVIRYYKPVSGYTVNFNANGGFSHGGAALTQLVSEGGYAISPDVAKGSDFFFGGWQLEGTEDCYDIGSFSITKDTKFIAKWIAFADWVAGGYRYSKVSLIFNGGKLNDERQLNLSIISGLIYTFPQNVVRNGYHLLGYEDTEGNFFGKTCVIPNSDITFVAVWTDESYFTATFDLNGGTYAGGGAVTQFITPGRSFSAPVVTKDDTFFKGWSVDGSLIDFPNYIMRKSTAFKAEWFSSASFNVNFVLSDCTRTGGGELTQSIKEGGSPVYPILKPAVPEFRFKGWSTVPNGSIYINTKSFIVSSNITLYSVWSLPTLYTVSFLGHDGTTDSLFPFLESGELVQRIYDGNSPSFPVLKTLPGYIFVGWRPSNSVSVLDDLDGFVVTRDIKFYAEFVSLNYTATFNLNGGTRTGGGELEQKLIYPAKPVLPVVELEGKVFSGWKYSVSGVEYVIKDISKAKITGANNIVFTAVWSDSVDWVAPVAFFSFSGVLLISAFFLIFKGHGKEGAICLVIALAAVAILTGVYLL